MLEDTQDDEETIERVAARARRRKTEAGRRRLGDGARSGIDGRTDAHLAWLTSSGSGHGRMSTFSSAWRLLGPFRVAATIGFRLGHLACRRSADARTIAGLVGESDPAYRRDRLETSIATAISAIPARMVASAD
jgi:hypothetical protein